jgi:hypothetical protein
MTDRIKISAQSQSRRNQDGAHWTPRLSVMTFLEALFSATLFFLDQFGIRATKQTQ